MKNNGKKIISFVICLVILISGIKIILVKAASASVSVSTSASSISKGNSVTVYVNISADEAIGYGVAISYDPGVLEYTGGADSGGGGTVYIISEGDGSSSSFSRSISFVAVANGSTSVSASAYAGGIFGYVSGSIAASYGSTSVTVTSPTTTEKPPATTEQPPSTEATTESTTEATTEDKEDTKECLLKSLTVSPGALEPSFSPDTTSYFLQVDEDVTAIDVNAVAQYSSSRVSVSGASNIIPGENYISITVTDKEGATKNYSIRVMAGKEKGDPFVTINGKKYDFVADKESELIPDGYKAVDETYEDWDIVAFMSPNRKILLVCLQDENEKQSLYIYEKEKNIFTLYKEYQAGENRYVILEWNDDIELPAGGEKSQLMIDGELVSAYKLKDSFYLLYAMNIKGDEGLYLYDFKEKTFMRYADFSDKDDAATNTDATPLDAVTDNIPTQEPEDEGFFTRQVLIYFLAGAVMLLLLFIVIVICLAVKNKKLKKQMGGEGGETLDLDENDDTYAYIGETNVEPVSEKTENAATMETVEESEVTDNAEISGELEVAEAVETVEEPEVTDNTENVKVSEEPETAGKMENFGEPEVTDDVEISVKKEEKNEIEEVPQITSFDTVIDSESDTYKEYEEQSEIIKNKIKVDYDANMDSAFNVDE